MKVLPIQPDLVDNLVRALQSGRLPPGVSAHIEQVHERLARPVRVAVLGRTAGGPARLVNALVGEAILPENAEMPPMQLQCGGVRKVDIVSCDGTHSRASRSDLDRLDPWTLAMVEFSAPLPILKHLSFLVVPLDGGSAEIDTALRWTCARTEMVLCCSGAPTAEIALWRRLPDAFADHGFLVIDLPEDSNTTGALASTEVAGRFRAVHRIGGASDEVATQRLRDALLAHVSAARQQDLEGALSLIARYQPRTQSAAGCIPSTNPDFTSQLAASSHVAISDDPKCAAASKATGEIASYLAAQAATLAQLCDRRDAEALTAVAPAVLSHCVESIDACSALAAPADPTVVDLIAEASDLVLLMQIEATRDAMTDAVALMLQLRTECETQLCA